MATASLELLINAGTIEEVPNTSDQYEIDGEQYTVPGDRYNAAMSIRRTRSRSQENEADVEQTKRVVGESQFERPYVTDLFTIGKENPNGPQVLSESTAKRFMTRTPETILVSDHLSGQAWGPYEQGGYALSVGSRPYADFLATEFNNAIQTAQADWPLYWQANFGPGFEVTVIEE